MLGRAELALTAYIADRPGGSTVWGAHPPNLPGALNLLAKVRTKLAETPLSEQPRLRSIWRQVGAVRAGLSHKKEGRSESYYALGRRDISDLAAKLREEVESLSSAVAPEHLEVRRSLIRRGKQFELWGGPVTIFGALCTLLAVAAAIQDRRALRRRAEIR